MTTDLAPAQIDELIANAWSSFDTLQRLAGRTGDWETAFVTARKHAVLFTEIIRQLQREKQELDDNLMQLKVAIWDTVRADNGLLAGPLQDSPVGRLLGPL